MREKIVPAVFLMLVLLIGFPSSTIDFSAFADSGIVSGIQYLISNGIMTV